MRKKRYPLSIHITTLFLIMTSIVGTVLIMMSYKHSQQLLLGTIEEVSQEHSDKLELVFKQSVAPVVTALNVLAVSPFINDESTQNKYHAWLSSLDLIFQQSPSLVALFYGSENGDFKLFRPIKTNKQRQEHSAPSKATMMVTETSTDGLTRITFLDGAHQVISQREQGQDLFDPRTRPWFLNAKRDGSIQLSEPYQFYFLKTPGITLSRRSSDQQYVLGADFTLNSLSTQIGDLAFSPQSRLALFDRHLNLLGHHQLDLDATTSITNSMRMNSREANNALQESVLAPLLLGNKASKQSIQSVEYNLNAWALTLTPVQLTANVTLFLAEATPHTDLLSDLISMRDRQVTVAVILLFICFGLVWLVANRLSMPLQKLMELTHNIARFDFKRTHYPKSMINEVANLAHSIELMEHTLHDLIALLRDTAGNQDFSVLAKTIAHQSYLITKAETILLYAYDNKQKQFEIAANHAIIPFKADLNEFVKDTPWLLAKLKMGEVVHLDRSENALNQYHDTIFNSDLYFFPLLNREKQLVGIVIIGYERAISKMQSDKHAFLRELLSFAEIAKDNIDQMQQQKEMLNAFIELIASAIDTKSPYTGGHCQRVPELTQWLTEAAVKDDRYYPLFSLDKKQWEALSLASWLHDCGKVTTPEYVVDKATKLETLYDRIHEIRMRFELLKQQAETDYWKAIANGSLQEKELEKLKSKHQQLDDDFAFVAQCNIGSERMEEENQARLDEIAKYQWKRTLSDQIGIAWTEKIRFEEESELPIMEPLLADKPQHCVPWEKGLSPQDLWQEDYVLKPGELKYNRGELYNLKVRSGTLTPEERFMINDHIIQTSVMLNKLPYPEHLKEIPKIASYHHERIDGKGYPFGLDDDELSIQAKVVAIADVFEALTSSDRPYKHGKNLEESLNIMTRMATTGHIDPKLYLLFLEKDIYKRYADAFLEPEQHSDVDTPQHIEKVKAYIRSLF
ncbi:HD domain-containing phosphohydrolase [Vibrio fortis]|uniref:HD domain-containing phosphohydrolase n=1 Tax=Vibrio fortis TaxID=212667 RepID=UPI0021C3C6E1|nr:HD domain-containing phosphohydrolase [Vibrio fortis]